MGNEPVRSSPHERIGKRYSRNPSVQPELTGIRGALHYLRKVAGGWYGNPKLSLMLLVLNILCSYNSGEEFKLHSTKA
jgi:hypothetical protein